MATYNVHMFAFSKDRKTIRVVDIPEAQHEQCKGKVHDILELIFHYGQNDFQRQPYYSVSVGDVAEVAGEYWMVMGTGWKKFTKEEFDALVPPTSQFAFMMDYQRFQEENKNKA